MRIAPVVNLAADQKSLLTKAAKGTSVSVRFSQRAQIVLLAAEGMQDKHPRFHIHFTPTSASWLNMVERFFRDLTDKRLRRGVFKSVPEVIHTINDYIEQHNTAPNPFVWTASAKDILEKVRRARAKLDMLQTA